MNSTLITRDQGRDLLISLLKECGITDAKIAFPGSWCSSVWFTAVPVADVFLDKYGRDMSSKTESHTCLVNFYDDNTAEDHTPNTFEMYGLAENGYYTISRDTTASEIQTFVDQWRPLRENEFPNSKYRQNLT